MENPFRIGILLLAGIASSLAVYFRWKVRGVRVSSLDDSTPRALELALRIAAMGLGAAVLCYLIYPDAVVSGSMGMPRVIRWTGALIGGFGVALMYWSLSSLGRNYSSTTASPVGGTLVTSGPYRWVRHPYYFAAILLVVATTLLSDNWIIGGFGAVMLAVLVARTPREEENLAREFGDSYREYQRRTGRFFPRL